VRPLDWPRVAYTARGANYHTCVSLRLARASLRYVSIRRRQRNSLTFTFTENSILHVPDTHNPTIPTTHTVNSIVHVPSTHKPTIPSTHTRNSTMLVRRTCFKCMFKTFKGSCSSLVLQQIKMYALQISFQHWNSQ